MMQRTDDADTYQWTLRTGLGIHEQYAGTTLGLGRLKSTTHSWTGKLGPRPPPAPVLRESEQHSGREGWEREFEANAEAWSKVLSRHRRLNQRPKASKD